ncbi:MAG: glycosyltransferase family 4 protein [Sphingomicrobium sp.]
MVPLHVSDREWPIRQEDVPDADVIIASWWETAEWMWHLPRRKGAKVHFIQGYDDPPDFVADRVEKVWRLPLFKIAVSQWLVDLGRERFEIEHIALVPNSIDHHLFKPKLRPKGNPPTIGFLFHEAALKDISVTIAAIQQLRRTIPATKVVSFGTSKPAPGQLPPGTEFHHLPAQEKIAQIYGRCDAWLSTSQREGFNLPPLEAMACGCPAICGKTGRPLEIIENGVNGYLVDQGDVGGFTDALSKILALPDQAWREMSQAAMSAVAHPTWEESSALFEQALERAVAGLT